MDEKAQYLSWKDYALPLIKQQTERFNKSINKIMAQYECDEITLKEFLFKLSKDFHAMRSIYTKASIDALNESEHLE